MTDSDFESPLIRTKLHPARGATRVVERTRLFERLDEGAKLPPTLVSAPAGYGKSTLVANWLSTVDHPVAWLSLDEDDSDLGVFARHLLAAVETAAPGTCSQTAELLRLAELPPAKVIAGVLASELAGLDGDLTLILDDYHLVHDPQIHDLMTGLLRHPPRPLRLVVLTRSDPPLPLASARLAGMVVEVRSQDLLV